VDSSIGVNSMRLLIVAGALALAGALVCAHSASAFVIYSGDGSGGTSQFADMRSHFGSGSNVPQESRTMPAQSVIINQGVLSPGWYFKRPRR
jgi:hypothetical protein